ncbi:hypothetical protein DFH27DRAFT_536900 [Peziza echinospora]|nr:hypothetical protein DFH27DRAFT_536900 [Peziza echinospora]
MVRRNVPWFQKKKFLQRSQSKIPTRRQSRTVIISHCIWVPTIFLTFPLLFPNFYPWRPVEDCTLRENNFTVSSSLVPVSSLAFSLILGTSTPYLITNSSKAYRGNSRTRTGSYSRVVDCVHS